MRAPRKTCSDCGYFFDTAEPDINMNDLGWKEGTFCLRNPPSTQMIPMQNEFTKQMAFQPITTMNMVAPNMPACGEFVEPEIIQICDSCLAHVKERFSVVLNGEAKQLCADCRDCMLEDHKDGTSESGN